MSVLMPILSHSLCSWETVNHPETPDEMGNRKGGQGRARKEQGALEYSTQCNCYKSSSNKSLRITFLTIYRKIKRFGKNQRQKIPESHFHSDLLQRDRGHCFVILHQAPQAGSPSQWICVSRTDTSHFKSVDSSGPFPPRPPPAPELGG